MTSVNEGTQVLLTFRETAVLAEVFLASCDRGSLVLRFEGTVGPYHKLIHLMWLEDGYADLFTGEYVGLMNLVELSPTAWTETLWVRSHEHA